jgi:protein gp37
MADKTNIAWCDSTLNFWSGCTKVSPGCAHCYAETLSNNKFFGGGKTLGKWGKGAPRKLHESAFKMAFALNRKPWICDGCGKAGEVGCAPMCCCNDRAETTNEIITIHRRRIFSLSLGDWLDDEVPVEWLARMLDTIRQCPDVIWILCTKRPENFRNRMVSAMKLIENSGRPADAHVWILDWVMGEKVPPNIILLASVENQAMADKRIPELLKIPAACHGLSLEPLLEPVLLDGLHRIAGNEFPKLEWLIIGGESGKNARPCNVDWIRSLVEQGKAAGVATFVKQLGSNPTMNQGSIKGFHPPDNPFPLFGKLKDKKGGDISEFPKDLQVREFPQINQLPSH